MAKQLMSASIAAPAYLGLNTQESGTTLEQGFAVEANNCIIDESGRLGSRKGYSYRTTSGGTDVELRGIHNYVGDAGHVGYVSWGSGEIYKGDTTLTALTSSSFDGNAWKATTYMGNVYLSQDGYNIQKIDSSFNVTTITGTDGAQKWGVLNAAYGRLWGARTAANKHTVYFTAIGTEKFTAQAGSGEIDLRHVWTSGGDEVVHVAGFNGYIVIFCKNSIVIYGDANSGDITIETASLGLVEVIENVGCIARGSIQDTGTDILFLTTSGLRSLNRVIQEKSNPISDLSANVRDDLIKQVSFENLEHVTGIYSPVDSLYLLVLPVTNIIYCFDTRGRLEDGTFRVTLWNGMGVLSGCISNNNELFFGMLNGVSRYGGYLDNASSSYYMSYYTNYFDFGQPTVNKILKHLGVTLIGGSGQGFKIKTAVDYTDVHHTYIANVKKTSVSEYGTKIPSDLALQAVAEELLADLVGSVLEQPLHDLLNQTVSGFKRGDIDNSGSISMGDARDVLHYIQGNGDAASNAWIDDNILGAMQADMETYGSYFFSSGASSGTLSLGEYSDPDTYSIGDTANPDTNTDDVFDVAEYGGGNNTDRVKIAIGGQGTVIQLGFEAEIQGDPLSLQKLDIYVKQGRSY